MTKVKQINYANGEIYGYHINCPACKTIHTFDLKRWTFNDNFEEPTFSPSMLANKDLKNPKYPKCHSFVRNGKIEFLNDCTHDLAGQTVDLLEIEQ